MGEDHPSFGEKVKHFNARLSFRAALPPGIRVMNPFRENGCATPASHAFYDRYYGDHRWRGIILGINPGRFGAGITGVPFTDPTRLASACGISVPGCPSAHEPSSVFVYEVIEAYGGVRRFYEDWYINSICPLGFVKMGANGRETNYNYYDSPQLAQAAEPFMLRCLRRQLDFGIFTDICFCLGTGKNARHIDALNAKYGFFGQIIPLEHPRYVAQYKWKERGAYVERYVRLLTEAASRHRQPANQAAG